MHQVQRRAWQRFPVELPIVIPSSGQIPEIKGVTRDVSLGGVFFYVDSWPFEAHDIEYRVIMPPQLVEGGKARAFCKGRVVRVERDLECGRMGVAATIDSYTLS